MRKLFRMNFEKTAIFVLLLILMISTANIYMQFFGLTETNKRIDPIDPPDIVKLTFPVMLLKADELYGQGNYKEAQSEYLMLTSLTTISKQQKANVYFKLGLCNYAMGEYEKASDSFIQSTNYNTSDALAYNNAAVCAYLAGNIDMAESYQKKAIDLLPAVEFHYNLGRIYESAERFEDAVIYYIAAVKGEDNITKEENIDPVKVNHKVIKLFPEKNKRDELSRELFMALKLKDSRDVFIIDDSEMDVKSDFDMRLYKTGSTGRLSCKYDRGKMDPYHLIDSVAWTVKKDGKVIYNSNKDEFAINIQSQDDYEVSLNLRYSGNKIKTSKKVINSWQIVDRAGQSSGIAYKPTGEMCKYYPYAAYEQVFEKDFQLSSKGFTDRFNVVWGKDNVTTRIMGGKDIIDAASSLYIVNDSDTDAGIWADLSFLLEDKRLKGKTISVKFYARKITENAVLDVRIRVRTDRIFNKGGEFSLNYRWQQISYDVYIPEDATGLTFSASIKPGDEIKMDGFIINIIK